MNALASPILELPRISINARFKQLNESASRGALAFFAACLFFSSDATAESCKIKYLFLEQERTPTRIKLPPSAIDIPTNSRTGCLTSSASMCGMALNSSMSSENLSEMTPIQRHDRVIREAISSRDIEAFERALPANPGQRLLVIRRSFALSAAFNAGELPIVNLVLKWSPDALKEQTRIKKSYMLDSVTQKWARDARYEKCCGPTKNRVSESDYAKLIELLLNADADPDGNPDGWQPLATVAALPSSEESMKVARLLLARGAKIGSAPGKGGSPLVRAAEAQNAELIRQMLSSQKAPQEALDESLVATPLVDGNPTIELLLKAGANINATSITFRRTTQFTPAFSAAGQFKYSGKPDMLKLFISYKVDPNRVPTPNNWDSPLMQVAHNPELMQGLLQLGADTKFQNAAGDTALHLAVRAPTEIFKASDDMRSLAEVAPGLDPAVRAKEVEMLLQFGADPLARNKAGFTPLKETGTGDSRIVDMLMSKGATLELTNQDIAYYRQYKAPIGPVSWAILNQKGPLAAGVVSRADKSHPDDCGALYYAAGTGAVDALVTILDSKKYSYSVVDDRNATPLMAAAANGKLEAVRILLDRRLVEVDERSPLAMESCGGGHAPSIPCPGGRRTALMYAAMSGHKNVVEELIRRGADVNARDLHRRSVLDFAANDRNEEIIGILKVHGATN